MEQSPRNKCAPGPIALALSGGGFRAVLFHLGVIAFLHESGRLPDVKIICSASGGSILAAHLVLNWAKYIHESEEVFDRAAAAILEFTRKDVRRRILRRWIFGLTSLSRLFGKFTLASLLENEYVDLYGKAELVDLKKTDSQPDLHILATNLTTGALCKFTKDGFVIVDGKNDRLIPASTMQVVRAVAASSAFPPLFPPIKIDPGELNTESRTLDKIQYLTDGGVFDNLGLNELRRILASAPEKPLIISSDASLTPDWTRKKYWFLVSRNVRANEILMHRLNELTTIGTDDPHCFRRIALGRGETNRIVAGLLDRIQASARNMRTDLDSFSDQDTYSLMRYGYLKAQEALKDQSTPVPQRTVWRRIKEHPPQSKTDSPSIKEARRRLWNLLNCRDLFTWLNLALALLWFSMAAGAVLLRDWYKLRSEKAIEENLRTTLSREEEEASKAREQVSLYQTGIAQIVGASTYVLSVVDASTKHPIEGATITVDISGASNPTPVRYTTSPDGIVAFKWQESEPPHVVVAADGFGTNDISLTHPTRIVQLDKTKRALTQSQ